MNSILSPDFNTMDGIMRPMDPTSGFVPVPLSGAPSERWDYDPHDGEMGGYPNQRRMNQPHDGESMHGVSDAINALSTFSMLWG